LETASKKELNKYNKARGANKILLKEEFAKIQGNEQKVGKTKSKTIDNKTIDRGEYMLPWAILKMQGGANDPAAVQGTKSIMTKCIMMGEPFYRKNWQSGRWEFLVFKGIQEEVFTQFPNFIIGYTMWSGRAPSVLTPPPHTHAYTFKQVYPSKPMGCCMST